MRRLGLIVLLLAVCAVPAWAARGTPIIRGIDCTATVSHVVGSQSGRTALTIQNVGTINAYLGGGRSIDTNAGVLTLHAGSAIEFGGSRGGDPTVGVWCVADGQVRLQVIEEF
ncbi:MAG TPA: hypothetical protein DCQ64_28540 [Candidatus Rokubacteria bacterium]|nr:hypothetical protein [Candidatus Rokubacteria bacterium]